MGNRERIGQTVVMFSCFMFLALLLAFPFFSDHLGKGAQLFIMVAQESVFKGDGEKFLKTKQAFPAKASWLAILHQVLKK